MSGPEVHDAPAEPSLTPEQLNEKLETLKASATREYSLKNYSAAAEYYSEAAEVQDEINGEMSPQNADLLYLYGRCLYHVAVSKSDVLGGKVASAEEPKRKKRKVAAESSASGASKSTGAIGDALKDGDQKLAEDVVEAVVEEKDGSKADAPTSSKPFFQITGDENWTDSEDEDDDAADAAAEEEEDDFAIAYEILDVARVLLGKKLGDLEAGAGKGKGEQPEARLVKERLADTHDLQAEISLENERFHDAINDTRDSLNLKLQLYPQEDSLVAEAHFKLSLALEFASVTQTQDGEGEDAEKKVASVDEAMRAEAASEMEKAIASTKLRISKEEARLPTLDAAQAEDRKRTIADVKEMVVDMEQRLVDLRNPAVSLTGALGPAGAPTGDDPIRGVLGAMLGESKVEQQQRVAEATATANDLTGLVVKKKKPKTTGDGTGEDSKGKRKAEDTNDPVSDTNGKKAKLEEV